MPYGSFIKLPALGWPSRPGGWVASATRCRAIRIHSRSCRSVAQHWYLCVPGRNRKQFIRAYPCGL